uniref:Non-canonical purine NTP phosphatase/PRRC1 domain-containing protein n=1 Tax=Plectus sambesii TaxID=2011161 RepID=A0A914XCH3_9BILA
MMAEVADEGNGFEIVEGDPPPAPNPPQFGGGLPPPSALPSFMSGLSSTAPVDPGMTPPPPTAFPSLPQVPQMPQMPPFPGAAPPPPTVPGDNPFAPRPAAPPTAAAAAAAGSVSPPPPPGPQPPFQMAPPASFNPAVRPAPPPASQQFQIGLDLPESSSSSSAAAAESESMQPIDPSGANSSAGMFGWIQKTVSGSDFLSKVAEKAKTGMDTMITTLDPQMKDYIAASGSIEIAIASDAEAKIAGVKDGFQRVYQHVVGRGLGAPGASASDFAAQPVGFQAGRAAALDRVSRLRNSGLVSQHIPIVAVENFVVETEPDQWFDFGCVLIDDPTTHVCVHILTQGTPLPSAVVDVLKRHTPADYPRRSSGFAVTTGQAMAECLGVAPEEWHKYVVGIPRRDLIAVAARSLAFVYKQRVFTPSN